jgi:hypothetical protein
VPDGTKEESHVKQLARWIAKENIAEEIYFVPYAKVLPPHVTRSTCTVVKVGETLPASDR